MVLAITPAGIPGGLHHFGRVTVARTLNSPAAPPLPLAPPPRFFPVIKRYPAGSITPVGAYHLLADHIPTMKYRSYDNTTVFNVFGGEAIYDNTMPESVQVTGLKGLIPPWQNIVQKGATEDGATYIDSLYDPIEADLTVRIRGRNGSFTRQVQRDWIASWDAKKPGTLSWFTHYLGYWWAPVQLNKPPADKLTGGTKLPQSFIWPAIAYSAFWQSYDCVDSLAIPFVGSSDNFASTTTTKLAGLTGWTITYSAVGGWLNETASGVLQVLGIPIELPGGGGIAAWVNDPNNAIPTQGVDAVAINSTYVSATDDQVISIRLAGIPTWFVYGEAFNDIWLRCPPPGTVAPGVTGIRLRLGLGYLRLSYFINSVETVLRFEPLILPPLPGETWTVICSGRTWTIQRGIIGQSTVTTVVEFGANSPKGAGFRCAGFGMHVAPDTIPAGLLQWTAGDNTAETHTGTVAMVNAGDQPMWPRFTLYGPGTFVIGDGPNNPGNMVTMGPLLPNQIVQLRTDPRKRGVTDITSQPATPQALTLWQTALEDFLSFAIGNNTIPLVAAIETAFGIVAPQGNIYSLLNGRFSDNSAIPAKPVAGPMQPYEIPVTITGGNANSSVVAAGTPLRRFPY